MPFQSIRSGFPWLAYYTKEGVNPDLVSVQSFNEPTGMYKCFAVGDSTKKVFDAKHAEIHEAVTYVIEEPIMKVTQSRLAHKEKAPIVWATESYLPYPYVRMVMDAEIYEMGEMTEEGDSYHFAFASRGTVQKDKSLARVGFQIRDPELPITGGYVTDYKDAEGHYYTPLIESTLSAQNFIRTSTFLVIPDAPPQFPPFQMSLICYDFVIVSARWAGVISKEYYWQIVTTAMKSKPDDSYLGMLEKDQKKRIYIDLTEEDDILAGWKKHWKKYKIEVGDIFVSLKK